MNLKVQLFLMFIMLGQAFSTKDPQKQNDSFQNQSADIFEFQKCIEKECIKLQQEVLKDAFLTIEYLSVFNCMKQRQECINVDQQISGNVRENILQIDNTLKCFQVCFSIKEFSEGIKNLNNCHLSCAERTYESFKTKNLSQYSI